MNKICFFRQHVSTFLRFQYFKELFLYFRSQDTLLVNTDQTLKPYLIWTSNRYDKQKDHSSIYNHVTTSLERAPKAEIFVYVSFGMNGVCNCVHIWYIYVRSQRYMWSCLLLHFRTLKQLKIFLCMLIWFFKSQEINSFKLYILKIWYVLGVHIWNFTALNGETDVCVIKHDMMLKATWNSHFLS